MRRENKYKKALETLRKAQKYEQNKEKIEAFDEIIQMAEGYCEGDLSEDDLVSNIRSIYYDFKRSDSQ